RVRVVQSPVCLALSDIGIFKEPEQMEVPVVKRNSDGKVTMTTNFPVNQIRYTTDGSEPTANSILYDGEFFLPNKSILKVKSFNLKMVGGKAGVYALENSKKDWKIIAVSHECKNDSGKSNLAIDEDNSTQWETWESDEEMYAGPQSITIDLGKEK